MHIRWPAALRRAPVEHGAGGAKRADDTDAAARPRRRRRNKEYVSDFAGFMDDFLDHHPEVVEDQRRGWSIWWNRPPDLAAQEKSATDRVPVGAYYYYDNAAPATPGGHGPGDDAPHAPGPRRR